MKHLKDVMTGKERPVPLPEDIYTRNQLARWRKKANAAQLVKLTHGNTQQADTDLDATDDNHGMLDASVGKPCIGEERQDKAEHVFENQHAGKCLDGHLA
jgi:hypothetical protein